MMKDADRASARYQVLRHFDGTRVRWLIYRRAGMVVKPTVKAWHKWCINYDPDSDYAIDEYETQAEAVAARDRLNSKYDLD